MTQTTSRGAAAAADDLRGSGHTVSVCHPDGAEACIAVSGGECPLERGTIDATLVVRTYAARDELPLERGAWCAIQRGVPLIVGGDPVGNPYGAWTAAEDDGSAVARTVETVVRLPLPGLSLIATHALHAALEGAGVPDRRARVEVRRRHGGVVADLIGVVGVTSSEAARVSVRVAGAIRAADRWVRRIDVTRDHTRATLPSS